MNVRGRTGTVDAVVDSIQRVIQTGSDLNWTVTSGDAEAQYTAQGLPPGLSIDAATGNIFGAPEKAGMFTVSIYALNQHGIGSETRHTIRGGGSSLLWLADHFGEAAVLSQLSLESLWTGDGDGDGLGNLLEYAFGGDPHQPRAGHLPELVLDPVSKEPQLTLSLSNAADDVETHLEYAINPNSPMWERIDLEPETVIENERRIETYRGLPTEARRGFFRLRVTVD